METGLDFYSLFSNCSLYSLYYFNKTNPLPNMWTCKHCNTEIEEDHFDMCWNCSTLKNPTEEETKVIEKQRARSKLLATPVPRVCLACNENLVSQGQKKFHEGSFPWGGKVSRINTNLFVVDIYSCPRCQEVKFYLPKKK